MAQLHTTRHKYLTFAFALLNPWHKKEIRGVSGAKQNIIYPARKAHAHCYIAICGLCGSTTFFHIIFQKTRYQKNIFELRMCFDFLYKVCLKYFSY